MNHLSTIKRRVKDAKTKIAVASSVAAGSVLFGSSVFAAIDTTAAGPISTAISGGITDYEAIFAMVLAAVVAFWALQKLQGVFFKK